MAKKTSGSPKGMTGKVVSIIAAVTAFIAAAAPGTYEFLDSTEDKAHMRAQKVEGMTELAWEKVRLELLYLREQIKDLKDTDRRQADVIGKMLVSGAFSLRMPEEHRAPSPAPVPSFDYPAVSEEGGEEEAAEEAMREPEDILLEPEPVAPRAKAVQQQLPVDLEREWLKKRGKVAGE